MINGETEMSVSSNYTIESGYNGKCRDVWDYRGDDEFVKDWLNEIKSKRYLLSGRVNVGAVFPYQALHTCVVETIFSICHDLCQPCDTRYLTVELYDRYVASQYFSVENVLKESKCKSKKWNVLIKQIKDQSLLRIMSCIQLASKYCSNSTIVTQDIAAEYLQNLGEKYSLTSIFHSEIRVYSAINFDVGVPTFLTIIDTLVHVIKKDVSQGIYRICVKILDILYLQHQEIYNRLFYSATGFWEKTRKSRMEFLAVECDGMFGAAATIVTAIRIKYPSNESLIDKVCRKLATYIDRTTDDVNCFSSILMEIIIVP